MGSYYIVRSVTGCFGASSKVDRCIEGIRTKKQAEYWLKLLRDTGLKGEIFWVDKI